MAASRDGGGGKSAKGGRKQQQRNKKKNNKGNNNNDNEDAYSNVRAQGVHVANQESAAALQALRDKVAASPRLQTLAASSHQVAAEKERVDVLKFDDERLDEKLLGGGDTTTTAANHRRKNNNDTSNNDTRLNDKQQRALTRRKQVRNKAVAARLEKHETRQLQAAVAAGEAQEILETTQPGLMEPENDMEHTYQMTQATLKRQHLDKEANKNVFDLTLTECAPYGFQYDRSGRYGLLHGEKGHLAILDNFHQSLVTELSVRERVRDACFLHNFHLFAVAQKNHAFIYDHNGAEVHRLDHHLGPLALQFLPHHWLLASVGRTGWLKYQDTSTGTVVAGFQTKTPCSGVMRQNTINAILHIGHTNGTVSLWCPSTSKYLVKMQCHRGAAITSMAIDSTGHTMVTGGADHKVRIWDLRMYKQRHYITCPGNTVPTTCDISQRGMLAVGHSGRVTTYAPSILHQMPQGGPYMHQLFPRCGPIETVRFRPFEDVLGVGHARGVSSMVIPGAGDPQLDTSEYHLNPHADSKQLREQEVRALLDKLQPDMIALDAQQVAGIEPSDHHSRLEQRQDRQESEDAKPKSKKRERTTKRGQSKIQVQMRRKQRNEATENRKLLKESREEEEKQQKRAKTGSFAADDDLEDATASSTPAALRRFF